MAQTAKGQGNQWFNLCLASSGEPKRLLWAGSGWEGDLTRVTYYGGSGPEPDPRISNALLIFLVTQLALLIWGRVGSGRPENM